MSLSPTLFRQGSRMFCVGFTPLICSARGFCCFHFETFQSQHPQVCRDCDLRLSNLRSGFHPWIWDPGIFGFDVRDREVEWMKEMRCFVGIHGRVQVYFGVSRIKDMRIATWMTIPTIMSLGPVLCFQVDDKIMQLQAAFERIISLEMFYDGVYCLWKQLWEREQIEETASQSTETWNQIVNPLKMVRLLKSKWKSSKIERRRMMLPKVFTIYNLIQYIWYQNI